MLNSLIVVDIGNTHIHIGRFNRGRVTASRTWSPDESVPSSVVAYASVNPAAERRFLSWLRRRSPATAFKMGRDFPVSIGNRYKHPRQVGIDRLANGVAARKRMGRSGRGRPFVVIDAGTAITIDLFSPRRGFLGGVIAPGPSTSARALARECALLPKVKVARVTRAIGRDTMANIRGGLYWGMVGLVEKTVERIAAELGTMPRVFVTGGEGRLLARLPIVDAFIPTLTLEGIGHAYRRATKR